MALKESEERFRMMANLLPLVVCTTDAEGNCNFLSDRWVEFTGHDISSSLGTGWLKLVHPQDREKIRNSWNASFTARTNFDIKFRLQNASGGYTATYANLKPRFDVSGSFGGYIGIMQDVSMGDQIMSSLEKIVLERTEDLRKKNAELRRAEKALQEKNEKLEQINDQLSSFAHVASHDLQEPLRKIQTFTARLFEIEGPKFSDKGKDLYQRIYRSSDRMKSLISDLLAYSRTDSSQDSFEEVDLNVLLDEVLGELEIKINEKSAIIENKGLPRINAIRFQLHQLFLNLVGNALKFSKNTEVPHIVISADLIEPATAPVQLDAGCDKYHLISVADNGIGFEPAAADRIFEIFKRLHSRSTYEGTGIGLAICKKIAENHHGAIKASGAVNGGARFDVYFPAC
jgi:PAS domain S-box-containing protein